MVQWYVRDNDYKLIIHVNFIIKCVCYISLRSNDCFMTDAALIDGQYKMDIISIVGPPEVGLSRVTSVMYGSI